MADKQGKFFDIGKEQYAFDIRAWRADVRALFEREEITQWEIGDLLLECEEYGKLTENEKVFFSRQAKRDWKTLKNYKSICSQFPRVPPDGSPSLRGDSLSFSAYRLLGPFSHADREKLLDWAKAAAKKDRCPMSVGALNSHIQLERCAGHLPKEASPKQEELVNPGPAVAFRKRDAVVKVKFTNVHKQLLRAFSDAIHKQNWDVRLDEVVHGVLCEWVKDNLDFLLDSVVKSDGRWAKLHPEARKVLTEAPGPRWLHGIADSPWYKLSVSPEKIADDAKKEADRLAQEEEYRRFLSRDSEGHRVCHEFGFKTRQETADDAGRATYSKAIAQGKSSDEAAKEAVKARKVWLPTREAIQNELEKLHAAAGVSRAKPSEAPLPSPSPVEPEPADPSPTPKPTASKVRVAMSLPKQYWMKDQKLEWLDKAVADNPCDLFLTPAGFVGETTCKGHIEGFETDDAPVTESWLLDRVGSICRKHNVHIGFGATVIRTDRNSEDFVYFDSDGQVLGSHSANVDYDRPVVPVQMPKLGIRVGTIFVWQVFSSQIWNDYKEKVNLLVHPLEFAPGANQQGMSEENGLKWVRKLKFESEYKEVPIACTCNTWDAGEEYLALVGWIEEPTGRTNYVRLPCIAETEKVVVAEYGPAMFDAIPNFPFGYAPGYSNEDFKALATKKMMRKALRIEKNAISGKLAKRTAAAMARRTKEIVPK
jgi:hypothetical protein